MATYTENYQLHQWVPEDDFLRTDFNTDFQKIDAALGALSTLAGGKASQEELDALESSLAGVRSTANSKCRVIAGSYVGDMNVPRTISLGATPQAVFLTADYSPRMGTASNGKTPIPTAGGFIIGNDASPFNRGGTTFYYLAFV